MFSTSVPYVFKVCDIFYSDAKAAIKYFLSKGCKCVILTLGERGAVFANRESIEPEYVNAIKVNSIDSTGAGDCFIGSLAYLLAYQKHLPMKDIVRAACFIASISCRNLGTQASFPDSSVLQMYLSEVHTNLKKWKNSYHIHSNCYT